MAEYVFTLFIWIFVYLMFYFPFVVKMESWYVFSRAVLLLCYFQQNVHRGSQLADNTR